tara:strand:+ start:62 stop:232 length:171 start_codon:yes stop_codon:yes gene_type:complete
MDKKRTTKEKKKIKYFHEVWENEEALLNIGLKESRRAKQERLDREKNGQTNKISST